MALLKLYPNVAVSAVVIFSVYVVDPDEFLNEKYVVWLSSLLCRMLTQEKFVPHSVSTLLYVVLVLVVVRLLLVESILCELCLPRDI